MASVAGQAGWKRPVSGRQEYMNAIRKLKGIRRRSKPTGPASRRAATRLAGVFILLAILLTAVPAFSQLRQLQQDTAGQLAISAANSAVRSQTLLQRINNVTRSLVTDPNVTAYLYSRAPDVRAADSLDTVLVRHAAQNADIIRSIGVYNAYFQEYRTSSGLQPTSELSSPVNGEQFSIQPREYKGTQSALEALTSPYIRMLTFVSLPEQTSVPANSGFIQINVNETLVRNSLVEINADSETVLIDSRGLVLSSTNPDRFITDIHFQSFGQQLLSASGTAGILENGLWGDGYLVAYEKPVKSNLTYASIQHTSTIYKSRFSSLLRQTLAILLILAAAYAAARKFQRQLLRSLQTTALRASGGEGGEGRIGWPDDPSADEFHLISQALLQGEQASRVARQKYLSDVLEGQIDPVSAETLAPVIRDLQAPAYLLVRARLDRFDELARTHAADLASYRFAVQNVTQELLSASWLVESVVSSSRDVTFLILLEHPAAPETLKDVLQSSQQNISRLFPFTVSFAVSHPFEDLTQAAAAAVDCKHLFSYRLYFGREAIIDADTARVALRTIRYPINAEKRILEGMNMHKPDTVTAGIREFIAAMATGYSDRTLTYLGQLLFTVFKQVDSSVELGDPDYQFYTETSLQLAASETMDDAQALLRQFCLDLLDISARKAQDTSDTRQERFIRELRAYLQKEYTNPNLTMESTAEAFGLSSGYLGKLYKSVTGASFNESLTELRMEKAAALLKETTLPANKVSERVGIANVTYFSTLFKKNFGVSPSQYREKSPPGG